MLASFLASCPIFAKHSPVLCDILAESYCQLKQYKKGTPIYEEGWVANEMYVILSGLVATYVMDPAIPAKGYWANETSVGSFGESAVYSFQSSSDLEVRRVENRYALEDTECLAVAAADFVEAVKRSSALDFAHRVELAKLFPGFRLCDEKQLQTIARAMRTLVFPKNSVLSVQGAPPDQCCFIVSGECRVVKRISPLTHLPPSPKLRFSGRPHALPPPSPQTEAELVELGTLSPTDFFGVTAVQPLISPEHLLTTSFPFLRCC
jgi:CRP-like cAMP-binding protein